MGLVNFLYAVDEIKSMYPINPNTAVVGTLEHRIPAKEQPYGGETLENAPAWHSINKRPAWSKTVWEDNLVYANENDSPSVKEQAHSEIGRGHRSPYLNHGDGHNLRAFDSVGVGFSPFSLSGHKTSAPRVNVKKMF